jgi:shikimate kinase
LDCAIVPDPATHRPTAASRARRAASIRAVNDAPNLVLVGPMGAGKTTVGRLLAARSGLAFVDLDTEVERRAGARVLELFEREGEAGFRVREREALAALLAGEGQVLATGGGAVLDPASRALMRARAFVAWLQADAAAQLRRLEGDLSRPLLQRGDRGAVLRELAARRDPLYAEVADLRVDTGNDAAERVAEALAAELASRWRPASPTTREARA